ncbi:uncharacterized protein LACBIDRAFT_331916 [Laccaria bicolor S238N-H82]|uniref:Predicted protein n=1 Tax=Laccaria bicolor (strain S238N-H82 / ATCC MYA-4686) TaxID=486041 RepID=B0DR16_LACBS|nr:uncharacterized protein LACBIDRAFT_331916 [Laccaria bicolor S238N-H82]EDR02920.1 predicted protein [Laccaria bicolor S238N-H82]|eukprot:XP_001886343.1 predicted protein [Laccaria bicolor S238N-H82]
MGECSRSPVGIGDVQTQLKNVQAKKSHGSTKIKGHILTLPEMRVVFNVEEKERQEREHIEREKEAQKAVDTLSQSAQVAQDIVFKVFDKLLTTYKKRDDVDSLIVSRGSSLCCSLNTCHQFSRNFSTATNNHKTYTHTLVQSDQNKQKVSKNRKITIKEKGCGSAECSTHKCKSQGRLVGLDDIISSIFTVNGLKGTKLSFRTGQ